MKSLNVYVRPKPELVLNFNPNHDDEGKFSETGGSGGGSGAGASKDSGDGEHGGSSATYPDLDELDKSENNFQRFKRAMHPNELPMEQHPTVLKTVYPGHKGYEQKDQDASKVDAHEKYYQAARSPEEKDASDLYSSGGYKDVNGYLRTGEITKQRGKNKLEERTAMMRQRVVESIPVLDRLAAKYTVPENVVVYRGIRLKKGQSLDPHSLMKDKGFISTSLNPTTAIEFTGLKDHGARLAINVPKGTHGWMPNAFDLAFANEQEITLPRGTKLKLNGKHRVIKGHIFHEADIHKD